MRTHELQTILESVKLNRSGSKQLLRKRILSLLTGPASKTKAVKQKILSVYKSRSRTQHTQQSSHYSQRGPQFQVPSGTEQFYRYYQQYSGPPPLPLPQVEMIRETKFEDLAFFKTRSTLLSPMYCRNNINSVNFSGIYYLTDLQRHDIIKSWIIAKQEYKIQIILRFMQLKQKENVSVRLPCNISVSVNNRECKLPTLNIPTKAGITPWRCNVPIDVTQQTDLKYPSQNTLQICWSDEPHEYMAVVYIAEKLTACELLEDLKKKPLQSSNKTINTIKECMQSETDGMHIDSLIWSIRDPLSKTKLELPARGKDCIHFQCFDAKQYLQMNELKQTWLCPICNKKAKYENLEIDEFFLNILQNPSLSDDCESIILYEDGSWTVKKPNYCKTSELESNDDKTTKRIDVITLSDSDNDDDIPSAKCSKSSPPKLEELKIKHEHINATIPEDLTQNNTNNSFVLVKQTNSDNLSENEMQIDECISKENNCVLDLSLKNDLPPTPSSDNQSVVSLNVLSDDSDKNPPSQLPYNYFDNYNFPGSISITPHYTEDSKASVNKKKKKKKQKNTSRPSVICTITLD